MGKTVSTATTIGKEKFELRFEDVDGDGKIGGEKDKVTLIQGEGEGAKVADVTAQWKGGKYDMHSSSGGLPAWMRPADDFLAQLTTAQSQDVAQEKARVAEVGARVNSLVVDGKEQEVPMVWSFSQEGATLRTDSAVVMKNPSPEELKLIHTIRAMGPGCGYVVARNPRVADTYYIISVKDIECKGAGKKDFLQAHYRELYRGK